MQVDDDYEEGFRSVTQEVDYADRKKAMQEIKQANLNMIQKAQQRRRKRVLMNNNLMSMDDAGSLISSARGSLRSSGRNSVAQSQHSSS